jgi:hypothetical protein
MLRRPAFVARFLDQLPDFAALRVRLQAKALTLSGLAALVFVAAVVQLDHRRCADVAQARAEALAQGLAPWLDGDAHAGLGSDPEKRLSDVTAAVEKLLGAGDFDGSLRTLRAKTESKAALAADPAHARANALETVLQAGKNVVRTDSDYRPELRDVLFENQSVSRVARGRVQAYAPIVDSWGATTAIVCLDGPAGAPWWRRALFGLGAALFAGIFLAGVALVTQRTAEELERHVLALGSAASTLAQGQMSGPVVLAARAPRELAELATALENVRQRLESQSTGAPLPAPTSPAASSDQVAALGEASEFDLGLLLQQLIEPARKLAHTRGIEVQLVFPDGLPSHLTGHPLALFRALDSLLRNAQRVTRKGRVTLRVSRAGSAGYEGKLRFEVADTSEGIAFKDQPELTSRLGAAAEADPNALQDPLEVASAFAHALGGELSFVSQPGQGSRFGFSAAFGGIPPSPATGFYPQEAALRGPAGLQANGQFGPPISSFTPRPVARRR